MKRCKTRDAQFGALRAGRARSEAMMAIELMPLAELCERLEYRQRLFLGHGLARLGRLIRSAAKNNDRNRPQLVKLQKAFAAFREKFTAHMREEANVAFPFIRQLESNAVRKTHARISLQTCTAHLEKQHFEADETFAELRALAENDCLPELRKDLLRFEQSLHEQIYEENQVLFPRALAVSRA